MLKRETCEALQQTCETLAAEVARLTALHDQIEAVLQEYGAPLAEPERGEVLTAPGGRRDGEPPPKLPKAFSFEGWARKYEARCKADGIKVVCEPHQGGWRVRAT